MQLTALPFGIQQIKKIEIYYFLSHVMELICLILKRLMMNIY